MAHASTAADEVAVTTAQVAAEVVEFIGNPQSDHQCEHEVKEFSDIRVQGEATQSNHQCERETIEFVATRIQSAFRGYLVSLNKHSLSHIYFLNFHLFSANLQMLMPVKRKHISGTWYGHKLDLFFFLVLTDCIVLINICGRVLQARKALRALRGIVKLQAIIRGRAVRRQAITTLKCLQSIVNIQSQASTRRFGTVEGTWNYDESKELQNWKDKITRVWNAERTDSS